MSSVSVSRKRPVVLIAYSLRDPASRGAAEKLLAKTKWNECKLRFAKNCFYSDEVNAYLAGFDADTVEFSFLDEASPEEAEAYIVLSRHSGGKPSLTVHYTGNPGPKAELGGNPWELSYTWPRLQAALLRTYRIVADEQGLADEFQVTLEATHHGPTCLKKPLVFIEIGSSEREWIREDAHEAMAETVFRVLSSDWTGATCTRVAVGIGDTHYPITHTRGVIEKKYCYSHIFSKYVLEYINENLLDQAVNKSKDTVDSILFAKIPGAIKRLVKSYGEKRGLFVGKV
jgi:D-aminoacyl-tRNA deacylase